MSTLISWGLSGGTRKGSACQGRRLRFDPWVRKIPRRRKWQPTPLFLLGEFHGQRSLAGYSPWGHNESDMTEQLNNNNQRRIFSTPPKGFGPRQCRSRQISLPLLQWWSCGSARQAADPEEGSNIRPLCPLSNSAVSNSW